jgi:diguanylate cyclase (GGDEF)-like protein
VLATYGVAHVYDLPPYLLQFGLDHADWEIDDLIFVVFISSAAVMAYGFRRYRDLMREFRARTRAEKEARDLARHDPLTKLPNRRFFEEKLDGYLQTVGAGRFALLMLDLDGFKAINDVHGHTAGDRALNEFARRISALLGPDAFFARMGGDEFSIIMPTIAAAEDAADLARRAIAAVAEPFSIDHTSVRVGVGIGIAIAPDDGSLAGDLVRRADRALYRAKSAGPSSVRFFEPEMDAIIERRAQMEHELRAAIASNSIVPHFQPLASLDGNHIIGFEALARWESERLGSISPVAFIPIAEKTGLIAALGEQLFRRACLAARSWPRTFTLSFNVSAVQLHDPAFGLRMLSILAETGFSPRQLEIELTETTLVANISIAQRVIGDLRQAGVRIALDDFGTGYAAMSQLLSLHLDKIKIDRSFVSRLGEGHDSQVIVRAILGLAKGFGLTVTAEGVEHEDQLAYLRANGCAEAQGYLFGRAIPAAEIPALLDSVPLGSVAA